MSKKEITILIVMLCIVIALCAGSAFIFYELTSVQFEGMDDFEKYRIAGFKTGYYLGSSCTIVILSFIFLAFKYLENRIPLHNKKIK